MMPIQIQQQEQAPVAQQPMHQLPSNNNTYQQQQQQQEQPQQQGMNNDNIDNVDFNSCEFLYDSALFGQIIFDTTKHSTNEFYNLSSQQPQQQDYTALVLNVTAAPLSISNPPQQMYQQQQPYQAQQTIKPWGP